MRTYGWLAYAWLVIALTACGEMKKAVDKLEEMDKEMAGESDTPPAPPAPATAEPAVPEPAAPVVPEPAVPVPAPVPTQVAVPVPAPVPTAAPKPAAEPTPAKSTATKTETKPEVVKPATTKPEPAKPQPAKVEPPKPEPSAVKPETTKPEPPAVKPEPAPEPAPAKAKTTIPQSKRVRVEAPRRVQELLDLDGRMQPWLNNTMKVIEQCYAGVLEDNAKAAGTIVFVLEMHKNSRPDADIKDLPPALSGIVACATGKLMRAARMPLFTGNEGEKHTVRVKFTP